MQYDKTYQKHIGHGYTSVLKDLWVPFERTYNMCKYLVA